ncbi:MAG: hypothetical protein KDC54_20380 [Lewinella sp.]|nr:hypothetical protein [Lewinella sp.]
MFRLSIASVILRYYLMMLVTIVIVFSQQYWLIPVVMLIAMSAILGYRVDNASSSESKVVPMRPEQRDEHRKAS